jgi:hypothetical protein
LAGSIAVLVLFVGAPPAGAVPVSVGPPNFCLTAGSSATDCHIQLDLANTGLSNGGANAGPFVDGHVTIVGTPGTSHTLHFSFTSDTNDGNLYLFNYLTLNLIDPSQITHTGSTTAHTFSGADLGGSFTFGNSGVLSNGFHADGFSDGPGRQFDICASIGSSSNGACSTGQGANNPVRDLSFDLTWATDTWADLLTQQFLVQELGGGQCVGTGCSAAGHIIVADPTTGVGTGLTGFAAWPDCADLGLPGCSAIVEAPEPSSLVLLGGALLGLGMFARRRRRTAA